jgi:hypothetical protein
VSGVQRLPLAPFRSPGSTAVAGPGTVVVATAGSRLRVRYWPCLGLWPIVASLLLALPLARWARSDGVFPSSVTCTTPVRAAATAAGAPPGDDLCSAHDARDIRTWTKLPCGAAPAALEALLESRGPFSRPLVYVVEIGADSGPRPGLSSAIDPTAGVDGATARALLLGCVEAPASAATPRTVQVMALDRDYLPSVVLLSCVLLVAAVLGLRRRVLVELDPAHRFAVVVERGFLRERRTTMVALDDIADVVVATGASGILGGRRVELVRRDGARVPLTDAYIPLTFHAHDQAARRLHAYLEGMRRSGAATGW